MIDISSQFACFIVIFDAGFVSYASKQFLYSQYRTGFPPVVSKKKYYFNAGFSDFIHFLVESQPFVIYPQWFYHFF